MNIIARVAKEVLTPSDTHCAPGEQCASKDYCRPDHGYSNGRCHEAPDKNKGQGNDKGKSNDKDKGKSNDRDRGKGNDRDRGKGNAGGNRK